MPRHCQTSDRAAFLQAWVRNPLLIASVTPSSRALAELITCEIHSGTGRVLELGPGTGVFTSLLLERGLPEGHLTLIEQHSSFAAMLRERYPAATVLTIDAARLGRHIPQEKSFGATVSGLPLLSMSSRKVMGILASSFRLMDGQGAFFQFTYGPRCPVRAEILDRLHLRAERIGWTPRNFPPAKVYRLTAQTTSSQRAPKRIGHVF